MNNLHRPESLLDGSKTILGYPLQHVISRLDALLLVLKSCQGQVCVEPWKTLHSDGSVNSLRDALQPENDVRYRSIPAVAFDRCENGYIIDAEGPQGLESYYSPWNFSWDFASWHFWDIWT